MKIKPELQIIELEIARLLREQGEGSLELEQIRKLKMLIETKQIALGQFVYKTDDEEAEQQATDDEILASLKKK